MGQVRVDRHESSYVTAVLPESLHISADLPESDTLYILLTPRLDHSLCFRLTLWITLFEHCLLEIDHARSLEYS